MPGLVRARGARGLRVFGKLWKEESVSIRNYIPSWSVLHQIAGKDKLGLGKAAQSSHQANLTPRTAEADEVLKSIYPYCAVGCG
jgi:formate dehydrogenase major subunit